MSETKKPETALDWYVRVTGQPAPLTHPKQTPTKKPEEDEEPSR